MTDSQLTYDEKYFEPLRAIEEKHFWFLSRNQFIGDLIEKYCDTPSQGSLIGMEIGCGTGNVLKYLTSRFPLQRILGMDLYMEGLRYAAIRGNASLIQADIYYPPFQGGFSWIGLFDIIEHLDEDEAVLKQTAALLNDDGFLIISVPAFPILWSYFDVAGKHKRRYTISSITEACEKAGLELVFTSYTNALIFPVLWVLRYLLQIGKAPQSLSEELLTQKTNSELRVIPVINWVLIKLLWLEGRLIQAGVRMPFGTSLMGIAKRKD
jgi:SAM-dependent methyltransferase